jgi:hypothetical protein
MASALIVTMTAAQAQMFMAGSPGVSPMGAATYRIPLLLPPGVGGLKPDLALQYNSQSGNGALGVGWSLDGLSAISRCPLTKAQDGAIRGVNMDAGDKFCLDGVRLVLVGGTYGLDSSEYRTEIESFSQIKAFGTAGTGPSYFVVKTKAGLTMEYGVTTDSRIEAQGSSEVRVWALNKVSDAGGNYYTLAYQEENANGDFRLSRIDYTGSIYQGPTNSIQLTYESRSDVGLKYVAGSIVSVTKRLSKVGAYLGQRLVKEYRLSYLGTVAAGKSRLSTVLECDASEACLEPLNIVWSSQNANGPIWQDDSSRTLPFPLSFDNRRGSSGQLIDLNGDGLADMQMSSLLTGYGPAGAGWAGLYASTWINTGTGWTTATSYVTPTYMSTQYQSVSPGVRMADFNGDGLPDILVSQGFMSPPLNKTYLNTGQGWMNVVQNPPPPILAFDSYVPTYYSGIATEDTGAQVIDVNGDGLPDIVIGQLNPGTGVSSRAVWINKNGGWELSPTYVLPVDISIKGTADTGVRLIDINGDGLVDIVKSSPDAIRRTWLNNGQAWTETTSYALPAVLLSDGILRGQLIDVNGDGLPDYIWSFNGFKLTFLNTGRGWQNPVLLKFDGSNWVSTWSWIDWGRATNYTYGFPADLSMSTLADTGTRMVDINGDGLPDIVSSRSVGGVVTNTAWLNTGAGWIQAPDAYKSPGPIAYDGLPDSGVRFQDINGDGLPDYVYSRCLTWDSTYRAKCTQKVDRVSINKTPLDLVVSIVEAVKKPIS